MHDLGKPHRVRDSYLVGADTKANTVPFPLLLSKQAQPRLPSTDGAGQAAPQTDAGLHNHILIQRPNAVLSFLLAGSSPFLPSNN